MTIDAETGTAEYGVGGGITWDSSRGRRVRRDRREGEGPHRQASAVRAARVDAPRPRRADPSGSSDTSSACGARPSTSGSRSMRVAVRAALDSAGAGTDRPVKIRLRLSRAGAIEVSSAALDRGAPEPVRLALDDVPVDPTDVFAVPQDDDAPPLRGRARATSRRGRHAPDQHPWRDHRDDGGERRRQAGRTLVDTAARRGTAPGDRACRAAWTNATIEERIIDVDEARTAQGLAVLNSVRGWRPAVLVDPASLGDRI